MHVSSSADSLDAALETTIVPTIAHVGNLEIVDTTLGTEVNSVKQKRLVIRILEFITFLTREEIAFCLLENTTEKNLSLNQNIPEVSSLMRDQHARKMSFKDHLTTILMG